MQSEHVKTADLIPYAGNAKPSLAALKESGGIEYAAAPGAACKVSFQFSKVRPQNRPGGGWKRLPPGQRIGPGLTGWAFFMGRQLRPGLGIRPGFGSLDPSLQARLL